MKTLLLNVLTAAFMLLMPNVNFAQAPPLGTTASFALFTAVGAFSNDGATYVTGDIGTNVGSFTGFPPGTVVGGIHVADPLSVQAAIDVDVAYSYMSGITCGVVLGTTLGNGQVLGPDVYCLGAASSLNGTLVLDGQGNPNSLFIFKIDGALSTEALSNVTLINGASACNVYWQVNGALGLGVGLGNNSVFQGTILANGAISLLEGSTLIGRGLSRGGAIALHNNIVNIAMGAVASIITAGGPTTFCEGSSVVLSGNNGGTWSNGATTPSITVTTAGNYFVTNTNACGSSTSNHIIVTVNPLPAATTGSNFTICTGSSVTLGASSVAGHTYLWTPATGLNSAIIARPVASPTVTTTYTLTETITATGCQKSNSVIVTVDQLPSAITITAGGATTFCADASVTLSGNNGGIWSNGASTPTIVVNTSGNYSVTNTNACGSITSNHIIVTVNPLPIAATGNDVTICNGNSVTLGAASIAGHSYSWTPTTGLSSATISNPVASPIVTTTYSLTETITATGCQESNSVIVTVDQLITSITITAGGATTFCIGGSVILSGNNGGVWSNGATTPSITVIASGDFFVTNTNACGVTTSNHIIVTVNPLPAAAAGSNATICSGSPVTIGAASIAGHTYSWTPTTGLSSSTISNPVASPTVTTTYTLTETITATGCQASNSVTVTVITGPSITEQPSSQTACLGTSASFTVTATGSDLTYQWRKGAINLTNGGNISGATSATLVINPVNANDAASDYNVVVTGTGACSPNVTSIIVSLAVNFQPVINIQPASQTACEGNSVSFSVDAAGTGLTYQWRKGTSNLINGGNISGATSAVLTINPANISDASANYNVVITGICLPVVISDNVALVVNSATAIITQPITQTACTGSSASFAVTATGTGLTYQWRKGTVNLVNGGNISGATSATLTINPVNIADAASNYNVVISGLCSGNVTSANAALIVNTIPVITTAPANQVACEGNSVSFTVIATGTGLTYQWRKGTANLVDGGNISGATTATLTINPVNLTDAAVNYNVVVTGTCSPAVTSNQVSLEVTAAPGVSTSACVGGSVSFSATATGPGLTYQWRKGTLNLVNGGNISGATSATLTINPVTLEDASSDYNVVVTGACSPYAISKSISLVVNTPAVIVTQPVNQVACEGTSVSFSVAATGAELTYQWRKGSVNLVNGGNISGATSAVLTINPMLASDVAPNYNVVITGACSSLVTSSDASLTLCSFTDIAPENADNTDAAFTTYPNPFRNSVTVTVNSLLLSKKAEFRMYNALGIQVMSSILTKNITTLGTSNLVAGIYLYKVIVDSETIYSGKLISQQ